MQLLVDEQNQIITYGYDFNLYVDRVDALDTDGTVLYSTTAYNEHNSVKSPVLLDTQIPPDFEPKKYIYINNVMTANTSYQQQHYSVDNESTALLYQYMPADFQAKLLSLYSNNFLNNLFFLKTKNLLPANIARGLDIYYIVSGTSVDSAGNVITLSSEDLGYQAQLQNLIFKLNARYRIEMEVGDIYDTVADIDKQVQMVTPIVLRLFKLVMDLYTQTQKTIPVGSLPAELQGAYENYADGYLGAVASGQYKDVIDVSTDVGGLITRNTTRKAQIGQIVQSEYLSKKV